jgi:hypothetical protein
VNTEEEAEYNRLEAEMEKIPSELKRVEGSIDAQIKLFTYYLECSEKQNLLRKHGRKRRLKDKIIKEMLEYGLSAIELKQKSVIAYNRKKDAFKRILTDRLNKIKNIHKKG